MARRFRIALTFNPDTVDEWRAFFVATFRLARAQRDWQILRVDGCTWMTWDKALAMEPDGILGTLEIERPVPMIDSPHPRVIIVNNSVIDHPFHRVIIDDIEAGRRAAHHLMAHNLAHYAYAGWSNAAFSEDHRRGFVEACTQAGLADRMETVDLLSIGHEPYVPQIDWLVGLPKPCGIVCANDSLGVRTIELAQAAGFAVPEDVAVMGIDDNEVQCIQSPVPLTSVNRDLHTQAYGAARYLDQWLRHGNEPPPVVRYPVGEVVMRHSTCVFGEPDPVVRQALQLIHSPSAIPATVTELLDLMAGVSRRRLETLFRQQLGRTPYQEIMRARIELVQRLLRSTTLSIDQIAFEAGFAGISHISRPFKAHTGMTPSEYRRRHRPDISLLQ